MTIEINDNLKKAVKSNNLNGTRASILGLISKDRRLPSFETPTFVKYANDSLSNFWVEDDGETDFPSKDKWDNDLWKLMCVELEYNFSKKKFDFIIDIMNHLRANGHPDFQPKEKQIEQTSPPTGTNKSRPSSHGKRPQSSGNDLPLTKTGAALGGVIGVIVGLIINRLIDSPKDSPIESSIIWGLIGSILIGGVGYFKDKNKK